MARGVGAQVPPTPPCSLVVAAAAGTETGTAIETGTGSGTGTLWSESGTAGQQQGVAAWSAPVQQQGQHEAAAGTGWDPTLQVEATVLTGLGPLTTHTQPTCGAAAAGQHV